MAAITFFQNCINILKTYSINGINLRKVCPVLGFKVLLMMPATVAGETSGKLSRPQSLSPEAQHCPTDAGCESLNKCAESFA